MAPYAAGLAISGLVYLTLIPFLPQWSVAGVIGFSLLVAGIAVVRYRHARTLRRIDNELDFKTLARRGDTTHARGLSAWTGEEHA